MNFNIKYLKIYFKIQMGKHKYSQMPNQMNFDFPT